ncbi:tyrosine-protein phosphatase non-receptor type, partial [Elysia marginata]
MVLTFRPTTANNQWKRSKDLGSFRSRAVRMSRDTRKCIKDFVHHVETLEAEQDVEGNGFNREYRNIEVKLITSRSQYFMFLWSKTRLYAIHACDDEHRVLLSPREGEEHSDYINASRMMGVKGTGGYIASQGPLAATVDDFWRMIWECNVEIVFMACKIVELGKIKCKQYWNDVDKSDPFGDITVFT